MPCELFLSFSSADQDVADRIVADVEHHTGWRFFQCTRPENNPAGGDWTVTLASQLAGCLAVVLVHSEHARASRYVHREIEMAVALGKPIVAIRLDDAAWAPGVDYLMRTLQAPVVRRDGLVDYLPHLRNALARQLPRALALPLDSVEDRRLKVDAVCHLARALATESVGVHLHGLGIRLEGLEGLFAASPCTANRCWDELCGVLRRVARLACDADGRRHAILPVISKEDLILFVLVAPAGSANDARLQLLDTWYRCLVRSMAEYGVALSTRADSLSLPSPSSAETPGMVARFLTGLGDKNGRSAGEAAPAELQVPDGGGHDKALREELRSLVRASEPLPRSLPVALTGAAAWQRFEAIAEQERELG
jgi:hypothetical protein